MATVRFSEDLKTQIRLKARTNMMHGVSRVYMDKLSAHWGQFIYDTAFGEPARVALTMPPEWFHWVDTITVRSVGGERVPSQHNYNVFTLTTKLPWPNRVISSEFIKEREYDSSLVLTDHAAWSELKAEVVAVNARVDAAVKRQTDFVELVDKIIGSYATLAPALKAWPPLWDLIPDNYREKHKQIVDRKSSGKAELSLGTDELARLTAMATAVKLGA